MTGEFAIALHTLVLLTKRECSLSSDEIAQSVCTHPARVRKVLAKLKRASLIIPKEGAGGGYTLARSADKINLQQVILAVGDAPVGTGWKPGSPYVDCCVAHGMADVLDEVYAKLNILCFDALRKQTVAETAKKIPGKNFLPPVKRSSRKTDG